MGDRRAGKTTVAGSLTQLWLYGIGVLEPRMPAVRLLARPPSFVDAVRLTWWIEKQAVYARKDAEYRAREIRGDALSDIRAQAVLAGIPWPSPPPDVGWALAVVIDDAQSIGQRTLGTLCC